MDRKHSKRESSGKHKCTLKVVDAVWDPLISRLHIALLNYARLFPKKRSDQMHWYPRKNKDQNRPLAWLLLEYVKERGDIGYSTALPKSMRSQWPKAHRQGACIVRSRSACGSRTAYHLTFDWRLRLLIKHKKLRKRNIRFNLYNVVTNPDPLLFIASCRNRLPKYYIIICSTNTAAVSRIFHIIIGLRDTNGTKY